jgi:hypothetical protein
LLFRNYQNLEGKITAYTITGSNLANADLSYDSEISFSTKPGIIFINYINGSEKETFKIINNSSTFRMQFVQEQGGFATAPEQKKSELKSGKGMLSDDYVINFANENLDPFSRNITVAPGSKYNIDEIINWSLKEIKYSSHTNTNTTIKMTKVEDDTILDERTSATGTFATKSISQRFNNEPEAGIQVKYELTAPYTDPATFIKTQFKNQEQILDTLRNASYYLTVTGNGETVTVINNGQIIATIPVGQELFFKKQGDQVSLEIIVSKPNYVSNTTNISMNKGPLTLPITLTPIIPPTVHDLYIIVKDINGVRIPNFTQTFKLENGTEKQYTTDANGVMHFLETEYGTPSTKLKVNKPFTCRHKLLPNAKVRRITSIRRIKFDKHTRYID